MILSLSYGFNWLLPWLSIELTQSIVVLVLTVKIILFVLGLWILSKNLKYDNFPKGRVSLILVSSIIVILLLGSNSIARDNWAEFKTPIDKTEVRAGTKIFISNLAKEQNKEELERERRDALLKLKDEIHKRRSDFELEMKKNRIEMQHLQHKYQKKEASELNV